MSEKSSTFVSQFETYIIYTLKNYIMKPSFKRKFVFAYIYLKFKYDLESNYVHPPLLLNLYTKKVIDSHYVCTILKSYQIINNVNPTYIDPTPSKIVNYYTVDDILCIYDSMSSTIRKYIKRYITKAYIDHINNKFSFL